MLHTDWIILLLPIRFDHEGFLGRLWPNGRPTVPARPGAAPSKSMRAMGVASAARLFESAPASVGAAAVRLGLSAWVVGSSTNGCSPWLVTRA